MRRGDPGEQLGHADVQVTARHYARWIGGEQYREPMHLSVGEVPADFDETVAVFDESADLVDVGAAPEG